MGFFDKLKISSIKQEVTKELLSAKQEVVQKFSDTTQKAGQQVSSMFSPVQKSISVSSSPITIEQPVKCGNYNVSTIENINRIPNNSFNAMRLLQKAATAHKRNGDIELAIACLRKSNEISDRAPKTGKLMQKEYLRILSYIALLKQPELVKAEEDKIKQIHPEFWDKRVSNRERIQKMISQNKDWNEDLILISTRSSCTICGHYHNRVYSISGKHRIYPKIPVEAINQTHECKDCSWSASLFIEGITTLKPITKEEMAEMDRRERIKK